MTITCYNFKVMPTILWYIYLIVYGGIGGASLPIEYMYMNKNKLIQIIPFYVILPFLQLKHSQAVCVAKPLSQAFHNSRKQPLFNLDNPDDPPWAF